MDMTAVCKVIICVGILQTWSLYHVLRAVDGTLFQVPEMVEWSEAERTCQKHNGKLFQPSETSFDVSLVSKYDFNDDMWVAATYVNVINVESASRSDSFIRCEMCQIEESCGISCLYKACGNHCNALCKSLYEPHTLVLSDRTSNWTEARQWCSDHLSEFVDKIQNASSLFSKGNCYAVWFWTKNVIQVQLHREIAPLNEQGECGILHDGTLSFTSCNRHLHPICERVLRAVDGTLFQVPEMVKWSEAERTCQKHNGKLFQPSETSFDMSLVSKYDFNDDMWVAATYVNVINVESASRSDSFIRCEMCQIEESCGISCLYKACGNHCNALCKSLYEPHTLVLSDRPNNWTEARQWCSDHLSEFVDKIQNASSLFSNGKCYAVWFWTKNVIQVQLHREIAPGNEQGECGILHDGTLSFTSCNRHLHPICERVTKTALETQRPFFSEGNKSGTLMNTKITYMTSTQDFRRTNPSNVTMKTSLTYEASSVAKYIAKRTTMGLKEENPSLLVPVVVTTSRNDVEDTPHKSDAGHIIGAVTGSFAFLMMTFLGIICIRRGLLQRIRENKSKYDGKNTKMHNTDIIDPNQCHDVPLETGSGFIVIAQLESNSEGSHTSVVGTISDLRKPASLLDPEGNKFNYETLTRNVNVNSSNPNSNIDYDGYEHLNRVQERRDDNVTGNIYDTVQFE